jgi:hypothetical protein
MKLDPECVIFCNSQFITIQQWLETVAREKADAVLEIDLSFCRHKLFQSLIDSLPKMFPNDELKAKIRKNELQNEFVLEIRRF